MVSPSLISTAISLPHQNGSGRTAIQLPPDNLPGHTISLFQQVPRVQVELKSENDVHAYIKAEVERVTAKYHHTFDRFKETTGIKHFLDTRSAEDTIVKRARGSTLLTPVHDEALWVGTIVVGTGDGQAWLTAKFDTGALDTIIHHGHYDAFRSSTSTFPFPEENFQLAYNDGTEAYGRVVLDTVTVADLAARHVAVGDATSSTVPSEHFQSVVGMASLMQSSNTVLRRPGLITALVAQGLMPKKLFCFGLWQGGSGRLDLGRMVHPYSDVISWTRVLNPQHGLWAAHFTISGVEDVQTAVVDTGTRLLVGPYELVKDVITAAGMMPIEHNGQVYGMYPPHGSTPRVSITIAGLEVVLSAASLEFRIFNGYIVAGITGKQDMDGWWMLGHTFLRNVYAAFDAEEEQLGFAPH
ncbi:hypothetical protein V8E36_007738 [Tilletia maclaganii]